MQSKRSFFDPTLYKKNLSRFWPLWGGSTLLGMLAPAMVLMSLLSGGYGWFDAREFSLALYSMTANAIPAITFCYAAVCAIAVWGYLYNARAVGMMHSLPISRTALFITNTLSGLTMMLVPYVAVGLSMCLLALGWGFMNFHAVVIASLSIILMTIAFFGLASFCITLTGNAFAFPVVYGGMAFLVPAASSLLANLSESLIPGATSNISDLARDLSPVLGIYRHLRVFHDEAADMYHLNGLGALGIYGGVGLLLLLAAWALYRRRHSECAGNVVAQKSMKPVFRYGLGILSGLSLGWFVYILLWGSLFQDGRYADRFVLGIAMVICSLLGFYAASMLLEKTVRVFHGSWKGAVTVSALMVLVLTGLCFDPFGVSTRIPDVDDVETVELCVDSRYEASGIPIVTADPTAIASIQELHRELVRQGDFIRSHQYKDDESMVYLSLQYRLKDGSWQSHSVELYIDKEKQDTEGAYEHRLKSVYTDPQIQESTVSLSEEELLSGISISSSAKDLWLDRNAAEGPNQMLELHKALLADAAEGHLFAGEFPFYRDLDTQIRITLELAPANSRKDPNDHRGPRYRSCWVYYNEQMLHTREVLTKLGFVDLSGNVIGAPMETSDGPVDPVPYTKEVPDASATGVTIVN